MIDLTNTTLTLDEIHALYLAAYYTACETDPGLDPHELAMAAVAAAVAAS